MFMSDREIIGLEANFPVYPSGLGIAVFSSILYGYLFKKIKTFML